MHAYLPDIVIVLGHGQLNPLPGLIGNPLLLLPLLGQPNLILLDELVTVGGVHHQKMQHHDVLEADDGVGGWVAGFSNYF